jgi:hypothetical protein
MQQSGRAGCKSLPTCSGVPMVPPPSLQHAAVFSQQSFSGRLQNQKFIILPFLKISEDKSKNRIRIRIH